MVRLDASDLATRLGREAEAGHIAALEIQLVALVNLFGGEMGHALCVDVAPQIGMGWDVAKQTRQRQRLCRQ